MARDSHGAFSVSAPRKELLGYLLYPSGRRVALYAGTGRAQNPPGRERHTRMGKPQWFPLVMGRKGQRRGYHPALRKTMGRSGVYMLRDRATGAYVYVGSSDAGRLYGTILHHFQDPSGKFERLGNWVSKAPERLEVAVFMMSPRKARKLEAEAIHHYRPLGNKEPAQLAKDVPF